MSERATLHYDGKELDLPIVEGSEHEKAVNISKLRDQTGLITLDYGYMNTGSTESAITFIDGDAGILRYRGYEIADLAEQDHPSYLETAWLLIYGELPSVSELDEFRFAIRKHTLLHEDVKRFFDGFPKDAHPMAILSSVVVALSTFYQDSNDVHDPDQIQLSVIRLMAKLPTIAAYAYKKSIGQPFLYPNNELDLIENFFTMMFAVPSERYEVAPVNVHALKQLLILHADHEQNCSTSTVRLVGSSEANIYASISAGINALWGPLHGGANQQVIETLETIRDNGGDVGVAVSRAKDPNDPFRLWGFGHRVYKNYDPRAVILKDTAERVLKEMEARDDLLDIALELEHTALTDQFFIDRRLYPNVDFYSGLIYRAMGFPTDMFTVLFALGRLPGWIAHWKEMNESSKSKIGRPRQIFTGPVARRYTTIDERELAIDRMDLTPTAAEAELRTECRAWLHESLPWEYGTGLPPRFDDLADEVAFGRTWQAQLAAGRWVGVAWPERYGGRGAGPIEHYIVTEELARARAPELVGRIGINLLGPTLLANGSDQQKARFLPNILDASEIWCQLFSEPGAGSDLASLRTSASKVDGGWILNGQKVWTSYAQFADWGACLARTNPGAKPQVGISYFIVDMRSPGVTVAPLRQITDESEFNEVFFDDVFVADDRVVGAVDEGWRVANSTLTHERGVNPRQLVIHSQLLDEMWKLAAGDSAGRGLDDPRIAPRLAQAFVELRIFQLHNWRSVSRTSKGLDPGPVGAINKLWWSEMSKRMHDTAMSVVGEAAPLWRGATENPGDGAWQRSWLYYQASSIWAGTNEIQRTLVGERTLGLPREPKPL